MTDYFALLQFHRQPWLEPDEVNTRFLQLSAPLHPDRVHNAAPDQIQTANHTFAELNAAASCLRDPKERLQHLLHLETGAPATAAQSIPSELMDLFARVGQTCRNVDQFLSERAKVTSPMLQAQLFAQGLDWSDRISELQTAVAGLHANAQSELKTISAQWPQQKPIDRLKTLAHILATTNRWTTQLNERFAALAG
jgi:hypothetical protein